MIFREFSRCLQSAVIYPSTTNAPPGTLLGTVLLQWKYTPLSLAAFSMWLLPINLVGTLISPCTTDTFPAMQLLSTDAHDQQLTSPAEALAQYPCTPIDKVYQISSAYFL